MLNCSYVRRSVERAKARPLADAPFSHRGMDVACVHQILSAQASGLEFLTLELIRKKKSEYGKAGYVTA